MSSVTTYAIFLLNTIKSIILPSLNISKVRIFSINLLIISSNFVTSAPPFINKPHQAVFFIVNYL